jgi:hypothetical protein
MKSWRVDHATLVFNSRLVRLNYEVLWALTLRNRQSVLIKEALKVNSVILGFLALIVMLIRIRLDGLQVRLPADSAVCLVHFLVSILVRVVVKGDKRLRCIVDVLDTIVVHFLHRLFQFLLMQDGAQIVRDKLSLGSTIELNQRTPSEVH